MPDIDDTTPPERPPVARNPQHQGLVNALHNHGIALSQIRRNVGQLRDRFAESEVGPVAPEMERLGREFRHEADSAAEVARQAEQLARSAG